MKRWRLPGRTVRLRLTLLQGALFLVSGSGMIGITYALAVNEYPVHSTQSLRGGPGTGLGSQPTSALAQSAAAHSADLRQFLAAAGIALAITVLLSLGFGWLVAGKILRPLRTMTASTRRIFADNLHQRLALTGPPDELTQLGDTIDALLARLESAFEAQRRFVANASHELRTPLTLEQAMLEVALADPDASVETLRVTCENVLGASRRQGRLIEALLTLARSQRGIEHSVELDLGAVTEQVLQSFAGQARDRRVILRSSLRHAQVAGDSQLIERLVANLVDNALRYNIDDGLVEVQIRVEADRAVVSVVNTGPPTPADQIERLLQPFQRLVDNRTAAQPDGLGLGLSIVSAIAKAHDASLDVSPARRGGLRIEVGFPLASGPEASGKRAGRGVGSPRPAHSFQEADHGRA